VLPFATGMPRYEVRETMSGTDKVLVRSGEDRILAIRRRPEGGVYAHLTDPAEASLIAKVERDASGTQFDMIAADGSRLATLTVPPPIMKGPLLDVYDRSYSAGSPRDGAVRFADGSGDVVMSAQLDAGRVTIESTGALPREVAILAGFVVYDKTRG
jgi:hypothetical protein